MDKNEAIKIIRSNFPTGRKILCEALEILIPELKENEDERIRKDLIRYLNTDMNENPSQSNSFYKKCITWLEKQGEVLESIKHKEAMLDCQTCANYKNECFPDRNIFKCFYPIKYSEKNPQDIDEKLDEQKPADKIEPKFRSGDFITDGERIFQIEKTVWERNNRNDGITYCESLIVNLRDGYTYADNTDLKKYHLWTIQDAKDGDVLVSANGGPFIYKNSVGKLTRFYTYVSITNQLYVDGVINECVYENTCKPATKEQRELLFQKMKEAGYEWDAEKKELKKVEQKPNFCHHEVDFSGCSEEYRKAYYDGWNNCNQQHSQLKAEQKPAWSEEDDSYYQLICAILDVEHPAGVFLATGIPYFRSETASCREIKDWLKSLKNKLSFHD